MFYLILNVIFASTFMLTIKWVQVRRREDILIVGAINYIVAAILVVPEFLRTGPPSAGAIWSGIGMGTCYFAAFFLVIHAVKWVGASSTSAIGVLSILVPIVCGVLIWREHPNSQQTLGIAVALTALLVISGATRLRRTDRDRSLASTESASGQPSRQRPWFTPWVLLMFFVLAGCSRLAQDAFKHTSDPSQRPTFLFAAFVAATIPSVVMLLWKGGRFSFLEFAFGLLMGSANVLQTFFILKALQNLKGFQVFPVTSAGGLILTTLVATRLLGERLSLRTYIGIALAVAALVLLHWVPGEG